jgi:hypothetical protein
MSCRKSWPPIIRLFITTHFLELSKPVDVFLNPLDFYWLLLLWIQWQCLFVIIQGSIRGYLLWLWNHQPYCPVGEQAHGYVFSWPRRSGCISGSAQQNHQGPYMFYCNIQVSKYDILWMILDTELQFIIYMFPYKDYRNIYGRRDLLSRSSILIVHWENYQRKQARGETFHHTPHHYFDRCNSSYCFEFNCVIISKF